MIWQAYGYSLLVAGFIGVALAYQEPGKSTAAGRVGARLILYPLLIIPVSGRLIGWW